MEQQTLTILCKLKVSLLDYGYCLIFRVHRRQAWNSRLYIHCHINLAWWHTCHPSMQELGAGASKVRDHLSYREHLRPAWDTWDAISKKKRANLLHDGRNFSELLARLQNKSHTMGRLWEAAPGRIYSQSHPIGVGTPVLRVRGAYICLYFIFKGHWGFGVLYFLNFLMWDRFHLQY